MRSKLTAILTRSFPLVLLALAGNPYRAVDALFSEDAATRAAARDELIARNDVTIAPALVDSVFFNAAGRTETVAVLERLLGESHGTSFKKWIEAIGRREDIVPAKGYVAFKSRLFAKIDPALAAFLDENAPRTIRAEEIVWGGVKKDGIPALDDPAFIPAKKATWMIDEEQVFGVAIGNDVRAYPGRILAWHEMANDRVGGRPVSLSYCTLCGAAILYDGHASDGRTYTFGSSGLLYRSNKLMYDRQTNTLWSQLTGEPVMGPLARKEIRLRVLPLTVTTWGEWRRMHPATRVLSLETGFQRDYRPGAAYGEYFASAETMFPVWKRSNAHKPKEWVLVVNIDSVRKIYPIDELAKAGIVHDRVAGRDIVIVGERAYFVSPSGTRLGPVPAHRAYWFGAYAFYPGAEVWSGAPATTTGDDDSENDF